MLPVGDATPDVTVVGAREAEEEATLPALDDATTAEDGAITELMGAADDAGTAAQALAAASGMPTATSNGQAAMTQLVAADWIFAVFSDLHWQATSVTEQVVEEVTALLMHVVAQAGI